MQAYIYVVIYKNYGQSTTVQYVTNDYSEAIRRAQSIINSDLTKTWKKYSDLKNNNHYCDIFANEEYNHYIVEAYNYGPSWISIESWLIEIDLNKGSI